MGEHFTNDDELGEHFKELLAVDGNGAVETDLPSGVPLRVVLIGPIKTWWGRMGSDEYRVYSQWRELVRAVLINHGCLVYAPHRAWSGGWHESAQLVNNAAIFESDLVVNVAPFDVEAVGTDAEVAVAEGHGVPVFRVPPGGKADLDPLIEQVRALQRM